MNLKADETALAKGLAKASEQVQKFGAQMLAAMHPVAELIRDHLAPLLADTAAQLEQLRRDGKIPPGSDDDE